MSYPEHRNLLAPLPADHPDLQAITVGLNPEEQRKLAALTQTVRLNMNLATVALSQMAYSVYAMQEIIRDPATLKEYCMAMFGFSNGHYYRILKAGKVIASYFTEKDGRLLDSAANLPLTAFQLLDAETDVSVIDTIKEKAQAGHLTMAEVKKLMDKHTKAVQTQLSQAQDKVVEQQGALVTLQSQLQQSEVKRKELEAQFHATTNQYHQQQQVLRHLAEERDAQMADLNDAREQLRILATTPAEVRYEDRPVLPDGFASLEDAIATKQAVLDDLHRTIQSQQSLAAATQDTLAKLTDELRSVESSARLLDELQLGVEAIAAKFPSALILQASESSPQVVPRLKAIAKTLRTLADTISLQEVAHA